MKTKRMTIAYWNTLQKGSKQNSLTQQHDEIISLCEKNMYKIQQISRQ